MTKRLIPPAGGGCNTVGSNIYRSPEGVPIEVSDAVANVLMANGWVNTPGTTIGTTIQRPKQPTKGQHFNDTVVGAVITWDGKKWRDASGAAV